MQYSMIVSASAARPLPPAGFQLRFEPLSGTGAALAFPCDAQGRVDLDALPERARHNYLFARAMVGRRYLSPQVLDGY